MKTTQTTDKQATDKTGNTIDFRKDTPPTDWLGKRVEERYGHLPVSDIKTEYDFVEEFIAELAELRCEPDCTNGNGNAGAGSSGKAGASSSGNADANGQLANGQLGVSCICSLLREMTCEEAPLVQKGEFVAVIEAAGYSQEDALAHYRDYAFTKLHDEHKQEFRRLIKERQNAHNWWAELRSDEANAQASAAGNEIRALDRKIAQELEAIMSA